MLRDSFIRYLIVAFGFMIFMAVSLGNAKEQDVTLKGFGSALFDAMDGTLDYDGRNPGNDKRCLSYADCPEWNGDPTTKVFYDLMGGKNGTGIVETDFNYNLHVYLCYINRDLDIINGEGSFEKRAIQSANNGMIPCPIGVHPSWDYDWETHILEAQMKAVQTPTPGPQAPLGKGLKGKS